MAHDSAPAPVPGRPLMKRIRTYIIAGLLVWIPLGITYLVLDVAVGLMDRTLVLIPPQYRPENLLGFPVPGLGIILTFVVLFVTGILAANLAGRRLVSFWESILHRIPFVRSIYSASKNFAEVVLGDTGNAFKKVLLIQYPRRGIYSLGFQTSTGLEEIQQRTAEELICVFMPTTPNPTSGFIIMVPRAEVIELDMDVEAALKMVVSLGVVVPRWTQRTLPPELAKAQAQS